MQRLTCGTRLVFVASPSLLKCRKGKGKATNCYMCQVEQPG